ncbi:LysR family transcriptional regulator [Spongiactinospora sp. TRM90649]|uniref:LysR family transcriptional regulator n=1 Tax=Spongiactinospora sp. TRM90649 TaxID=3031114 RepID=UPI0023F6C2DA|nr:LysR family transcriptional regulator [Spongiactinospora sp. TRM90649]MDF5752392.1 LysR family transcriptional regulator [Spongiactinospora sp. TRM90649]
MPTLAQLRAFLAVAEHLHFREAAATLRMSQSALSGAAYALEEVLGVKLLERTTRKVLLTPEGDRAAVHALRVLRSVDDLMSIEICREVGNRATATTYATSLPTLVQLVAGGFGVTLLPESAVPVEGGPGVRLALRRFRSPAPGRTIGLAYRASSGKAAEYRQLARAMRAAVRESGMVVTLAGD